MTTCLAILINMKNVKISYSCSNNNSKIIDNHHQKLIDKLYWNNNDNLKQSCTCKIKNECTVRNKCYLNNTIYQANIPTRENDTNKKQTYVLQVETGNLEITTTSNYSKIQH